jgi:metal-responsive CopG/Arc/MetJ family transcriptional regulator
MAMIRTTVSIDESLFKRAEELAHELHISRSRLYSLALESFIEEYEKRKLVNSPGGVNIDELTPAKHNFFADRPAGTWS